MKRFPDASAIRYQLHRLFVTAMLAVAAFALLAEVAHAQSGTLCGEPAEQPGLLLSAYVGNLEIYFPVEPSTCEKLVRGATAACHRAVSDAAACRERIASGLFKNTKLVRKDAIAPAQCVRDAQNLLDGIRATAEAGAELGHVRCDEDFAGELIAFCV